MRPMYMEEKPKEPVKAMRGTALRAKTWEAEAALRMLENNLDPEVALIPEQLIAATGTEKKAERIERVLTTDPMMGIFRYVDAGYEEAIEFAKKKEVKIPGLKL